jgi:hypothetical protein
MKYVLGADAQEHVLAGIFEIPAVDAGTLGIRVGAERAHGFCVDY